MQLFILTAALLTLVSFSYGIGRRRAMAVVRQDLRALHSLPSYHGY
ncbi:MAG: hypothetical protein EPN20_17790, partial [Magnetospirillum sp.]